MSSLTSQVRDPSVALRDADEAIVARTAEHGMSGASLAVRAVRAAWDLGSLHVASNFFLDGVVGSAHIPASGPCIVMANHTSIGDLLVLNTVLVAVRGEPPALLAKADKFTTGMSLLYQALGGIPVDRDNLELEAVEQVLEEGKVLVIFPEGTRGPGGGRLVPFRNGPFTFAVRAGVPVLPAALLGTEGILPKGRILPRANRARVAFGCPLEPDSTLSKRARAARLRHETRTAVGNMLTELSGGAWNRDEAAEELGTLADAVLMDVLDRPGEVSRRAAQRQTRRLLRIAERTDPGNARLRALRDCRNLLPALAGPSAIRGLRVRLHPNTVPALRQAGADEPEWRSVTTALGRLAVAPARRRGSSA